MPNARVPVTCLLALTVALPGGAQEPSSAPVRKVGARERAALGALISHVDAVARGEGPERTAGWQVHYLQTADGFGYVPFSLVLDQEDGAGDRLVLYVRVASHGLPDSVVQRSALADWLSLGAPEATAPRAGRFVSVPRGEMPVGGAAMHTGRDTSSVEASTALRLHDRERERAHEQELAEQAERERRERGLTPEPDVYPFEDFDFAPSLSSGGGGAPGSLTLRRSVSVPPGEYDLYVALARRGGSAKAPLARVAVFKQALHVPVQAPGELALSSVVLASRLDPLTSPVPPDQQGPNPYVLGWTSVTPAAGGILMTGEPLGVAFQVNHPRSNARHKPDVRVEYRVVRAGADGSQRIQLLGAQVYDATTLPADFSLERGQQILVIQDLSPAALPPGSYELEIAVTDKLAARTVTTRVPLTVSNASARR